MPITKEIFKAGDWTDSKGRRSSFTEKDVQAMADNFNNETGLNSEKQKVPVFAGHPSSPGKAPAYAWIGKVWKKGKSLFAEFKDTVDKAEKALNASAFKDVSISVSKNILSHVGLTNLPAVAGLEDFKLEGEDAETYTFSEDFAHDGDDHKMGFVGRLFQSLRDWIIDQKNLETADRVVPQWEIDALKRTQESQYTSKKLSQKTKGDRTMPKTIEELEAENKILTESNTQMTADLETEKTKVTDSEKKFTDEKKAHDDLKTELSAAEEKSLDTEDTNLIDGLVKDFQVAPAEKELILDTLKSKRGMEEKEFTSLEDESKKVKLTPRDRFIEILKARPAVIVSNDFSKNNMGAGKKSKMQILVAEKMKADTNLSHADASSLVFQENPELTTQSADESEFVQE